MERGDPELEAVLDDKFGRSDLASPSNQKPVHAPRSHVKASTSGSFSGKVSKPIGEIIGPDPIPRKGEFETEDHSLEDRGIAPHQLGTPLSHQTHVVSPARTQPASPASKPKG